MAAPRQGEVWLCEHKDFGGRRVSVTTNVSNLGVYSLVALRRQVPNSSYFFFFFVISP